MKNHKQFDQVKPYSYLIYQKSTGKWYYGIRWKNWSTLGTTPNEDFWKVYFTSSGNIAAEIELNGLDDFVVELRQTFDTPEEADAWEKRFLRKVKALENQDKWWNANIGNNKVTTERGRKKISETHSGVPKTTEHKKNASKAQKGKPKKSTTYQSNEYREMMSKLKSGPGNAMYGKPCSEERAENISRAKKGKPAKNKGLKMSGVGCKNVSIGMAKNNEMKTCEVCNKTMGKRAFKQYGHGPGCTQQQCEHCGVWEAKTKYDSSHGNKCKYNPNREKPFVSKPKKKEVK